MNTEKHLKDYTVKMIKTLIITIPFMVLLGVATARAEAIPPTDTRLITCILYAESAGETSESWTAKLNTYYAMKRRAESLLDTMKRVSSAYRNKSKQYRKADTQSLNTYEIKVYNTMLKHVKTFTPSAGWKYVHHESISFYKDYNSMIKALKPKWGNKVDYNNPLKIGKEYYFKLKV